LDQIIELTGQMDQRLLATVYWCLGTLVGVFVLLIGFNWFTNFRIQQREISALREELSAGLTNARSKLEQANTATLQGLKDDLQKTAATASESAVAPLKERLNTLESSINELNANFVEIEVDKWMARPVYTNAIRSQLTYLRLVRKTDSWSFNNGLDKLERIFVAALKQENPMKPDADDTANITRFLSHTEKDNPVIVARLRELLSDLIKKGT